MDSIISQLAANVILGRSDNQSPFPEDKAGQPGVLELTQRALETGIDVQEILDHGLLAVMDIVGKRFRAGDLFIPEVMVSAQALKAGMEILRPSLAAIGLQPEHKVVIGTVEGDLHDIGKSLVSMMLQGARFAITDLGVDVSVQTFVEAVRDIQPQIVGLSSLLTTTMPAMKRVIDALNEAGLREQVKILVGGAPVTQDYADAIGADAYGTDAVLAVEKAKELLELI